MKYYSTRDNQLRIGAAEAIKMGLSRDGGLLTPCQIPEIDESFLRRMVPLLSQSSSSLAVMGDFLLFTDSSFIYALLWQFRLSKLATSICFTSSSAKASTASSL